MKPFYLFFVSLSFFNRHLKCQSNKLLVAEFSDRNFTRINVSQRILCEIEHLHHNYKIKGAYNHEKYP